MSDAHELFDNPGDCVAYSRLLKKLLVVGRLEKDAGWLKCNWSAKDVSKIL